jgi:hypothetical protein
MKHMFWILICMAMFVGCKPADSTPPADDSGADAVEAVDDAANDTQ